MTRLTIDAQGRAIPAKAQMLDFISTSLVRWQKQTKENFKGLSGVLQFFEIVDKMGEDDEFAKSGGWIGAITPHLELSRELSTCEKTQNLNVITNLALAQVSNSFSYFLKSEYFGRCAAFTKGLGLVKLALILEPENPRAQECLGILTPLWIVGSLHSKTERASKIQRWRWSLFGQPWWSELSATGQSTEIACWLVCRYADKKHDLTLRNATEQLYRFLEVGHDLRYDDAASVVENSFRLLKMVHPMVASKFKDSVGSIATSQSESFKKKEFAAAILSRI